MLTKLLDIAGIGRLLRARLRRFGLRQAELAAISGVGNRFLSDLENGKSTIEFGRALKVLNTLGLVLRVEVRGWQDLGDQDGS